MDDQRRYAPLKIDFARAPYRRLAVVVAKSVAGEREESNLNVFK